MLDRTLQVSTLLAIVGLGVYVSRAMAPVLDLSSRFDALATGVDARLKALEVEERARSVPTTGDDATLGETLSDDTTPGALLALNRSGEWSVAATLAEDMLASAAGDLVPNDRAQVIASLAYSRMRLGNDGGARSALEDFEALVDGGSPGLPPGHWLRKLAAGVRDELNADTALPPQPKDDFWRVADAAALGMNVEAVEEHRALAEETGADACLVVHRGQIVSEWTSERFERPVHAMSSTKSITNLLVGCAIADGLLEGIDVPVSQFLPEWADADRAGVTLRHLLSHTSGLPKLESESVGFVSDKNAFVRRLVPTSPPDSTFAYSNEGVQLLSPILDAALGEPVQDYAQRRLFEPLGMRDTRLNLDSAGHAWTYADMVTTPRDMARIGLMMLQGGVWEGRRIVPQDWIERSTRAAQPFREDCGLLWWIHADPPGFAALGYLHTDIHVLPALDLVVIRAQSRLQSGADYPDFRSRARSMWSKMVGE